MTMMLKGGGATRDNRPLGLGLGLGFGLGLGLGLGLGFGGGIEIHLDEIRTYITSQI